MQTIDFRLEYARGEWEAEKASWRAVIQLNLVRSILSILETLQAEIDGEPLLELDDTESADIPLDGNDSNLSSQLSGDEVQHLQMFHLRLSPLHRVEMDLKLKLGAGTEELTSMDELPESSLSLGNENYPYEAPDSRHMVRSRKSRRRKIQGEEMVVRGLRWREFLSYGRRPGFTERTRASLDMQDAADKSVAEILAGCSDDMKMLWTNPTVRDILKKRRIEMENNAGL